MDNPMSDTQNFGGLINNPELCLNYAGNLSQFVKDVEIDILEKRVSLEDVRTDLKAFEQTLILDGVAGRNAEERAANLAVSLSESDDVSELRGQELTLRRLITKTQAERDHAERMVKLLTAALRGRSD